MQSTVRAKAKQFASKNSDLLNQKKFYQFAQKIKLFGHRKFQSKKMDEAAAMFLEGASALYCIEQVQKNIPLELMDQLIDIYSNDPNALTKQSEQEIVEILKKRTVQNRQLDLLRKIVVKSGSQPKVLTKFLISQNIKRKSFVNVEKLASTLSRPQSCEFVEKWTACPELNKQQLPALWCRMCFHRALIHSIDDGQETLRKISELYPDDNPYVVFTGFVLKSALMNSKNAYETIERTYKAFLESDPVFEALFNSFGSKYFGIERKKGGLLSLIQ